MSYIRSSTNLVFMVDWKTIFDEPTGNDPVALNLGSMGKGEAWVNGQSIGRYWVSFLTSQGSPSQTRYSIQIFVFGFNFVSILNTYYDLSRQ